MQRPCAKRDPNGCSLPIPQMERRCRRPRRARLIGALRGAALQHDGRPVHPRPNVLDARPVPAVPLRAHHESGPARHRAPLVPLRPVGVRRVQDRRCHPRHQPPRRAVAGPDPRCFHGRGGHGGLRRHLPAAHRCGGGQRRYAGGCEREALRGEPGRLRHREAAHQPAFHRRRVGGGCVPVGRDAGHALLPRVALRRRRGVQRIRVRLHLRVPGAHAPFVRWPARRERAGEPAGRAPPSTPTTSTA